MKYLINSFREGETVLNQGEYKSHYDEVLEVIKNITDEDIKNRHLQKYSTKMSLSYAINDLLKERLTAQGWSPESAIFQDNDYDAKRWRLDFAKGPISIEVAFNHGEAIAWNLLKPVLASELNHVQKAIQTKAGIIICATESLKRAGAFDSAVGEFEKFGRYLKPLSSVLTTPLVLVGLEAPETFSLIKTKANGKNVGIIANKGNIQNDQDLEITVS